MKCNWWRVERSLITHVCCIFCDLDDNIFSRRSSVIVPRTNASNPGPQLPCFTAGSSTYPSDGLRLQGILSGWTRTLKRKFLDTCFWGFLWVNVAFARTVLKSSVRAELGLGVRSYGLLGTRRIVDPCTLARKRYANPARPRVITSYEV